MTNEIKASPVYSKDNPFLSSIKENRRLNKTGSEKDTRHIAVDVAGSGIDYEVGDSLAVFPSNDPAAVDELLGRVGCGGDEPVRLPKEEKPVPLREALLHRLTVTMQSRKFLESLRERVTEPAERERLDSLLRPEARAEVTEFLKQRECIDLLEEFPSVRFAGAQDFVDQLKRMVPRLYSIASSPLVYPEEIHLTVAVVRYRTNNRDRIGVCSTYLADRAPLGVREIPVFLAKSHFRLPEDRGRDIIMVGPGTGIAPFRAFLQERAARGDSGRNWLFFGDQRREYDYLYGEEFERYLKEGVLDRVSLAFSRDQETKIYVQHRMLEEADRLWKWLNAGACFYVCGDAHRMAKDVDAALHRVVQEKGGMIEEEAHNYVKLMRKEKRYQRDVY